MAAFQENNESIFCLDFSPAGLIYHVSHTLLSLPAFQGLLNMVLVPFCSTSVLWKACFVLNYLHAHLKIKYLAVSSLRVHRKQNLLRITNLGMLTCLWPRENVCACPHHVAILDAQSPSSWGLKVQGDYGTPAPPPFFLHFLLQLTFQEALEHG